MSIKKQDSLKPKRFDPSRGIRKARQKRSQRKEWSLEVSGIEFTWSSKMERVELIRKGLPYEAIEVISSKAAIPVSKFLQYLNLPQTTYNKKKREKDNMSSRDSEIILILSELLDLGVKAFNDEKEKFHRWLKKPNRSLGGVSPENLFDSITGINEVRNALNRIEYGNLA